VRLKADAQTVPYVDPGTPLEASQQLILLMPLVAAPNFWWRSPTECGDFIETSRQWAWYQIMEYSR
jgi:hypothetical protein